MDENEFKFGFLPIFLFMAEGGSLVSFGMQRAGVEIAKACEMENEQPNNYLENNGLKIANEWRMNNEEWNRFDIRNQSAVELTWVKKNFQRYFSLSSESYFNCLNFLLFHQKKGQVRIQIPN